MPFRFRTADLACGWRSPAVQPKLSHQVLMFAYLSCQEAICRMHKGAQVRQSCVGFSNFPAFLQISSFTQAIGCAVSVYVFITQGLFSNAVVTPLVDQLRRMIRLHPTKLEDDVATAFAKQLRGDQKVCRTGGPDFCSKRQMPRKTTQVRKSKCPAKKSKNLAPRPIIN